MPEYISVTVHSQKYFWLLLVLSAALLIPGLGTTDLWIFDEVRNAQCAREMYERGDWIVPTFNGGIRTLKPPLHYYFMFAGFELFGVTEWGARFFSAIAGILTILCTFYFVKRFSGSLHAFISSLVLLASGHFLFEFRMSVPDPYLILLNTVSLFTAYAYFREKKMYWLLLCAATLGLGTLAKGPVAIALPGAAVFIWLIWEKRLKEIFSWKILVAAVLMLGIAFPWYWLVHKATAGEWTRGFFLQHNIGRFSEAMEGHGGPFILVLLIVLIGMLPASVFLGEAFRNFKTKFKDPFLKLALCVAGFFIVFYSISGTKLPNYAMPCYPFVAILLADFITKAWQEKQQVKKYPFIILLIINLALPVTGYFAIKNEVNTIGLENSAGFLLLLTIAAITALYYISKHNFRKAVLVSFLLYSVFHIILFNFLYPAVYQNNPMTKTIDEVKKFDNIVSYQVFHPSYTFYLENPVPVFTNIDSLNLYLKQNKAAVISRKNFTDDLKNIGLNELHSIHDLFEGSTTVIYTNK